MRSPKPKSVVLLVLAPLVSLGCVHVKPYDRARLAHPTMTAQEQGRAAAHVLAVHEGAVGGGALSESGCGCN